VLRYILRHCGVGKLRLIPQNLRALHLELFSLPSESDFLLFHPNFIKNKKEYSMLNPFFII
jgi:hypothetical protein